MADHISYSIRRRSDYTPPSSPSDDAIEAVPQGTRREPNRFEGFWLYESEMDRLKQWPKLTKSWARRRLEE